MIPNWLSHRIGWGHPLNAYKTFFDLFGSWPGLAHEIMLMPVVPDNGADLQFMMLPSHLFAHAPTSTYGLAGKTKKPQFPYYVNAGPGKQFELH